MTLPRFLSASEVEGLMLTLGLSIDRQSVARALRLVPLDGCIPPGRRGQRWTIPKPALLQLLVVCLARRAGTGCFPLSFDRVYLDAAEFLMEEDPELARTMPASLKKAVRDRREARRRNPWWRGDVGRVGPG
jgi:hypothetical protein